MIWSSQFHNKYIAKHRNLYSIIFSWTKVVRYIAWLDLTKIFFWVGLGRILSLAAMLAYYSELCILVFQCTYIIRAMHSSLEWTRLPCPDQSGTTTTASSSTAPLSATINAGKKPSRPFAILHLMKHSVWYFSEAASRPNFDFFFAIEFQSMDINYITTTMVRQFSTLITMHYLTPSTKGGHRSKNPMQELSDWPCLAMQKIGNGQIVYNCTVYMTRIL